jgi:hypothetical protein
MQPEDDGSQSFSSQLAPVLRADGGAYDFASQTFEYDSVKNA